MTTNEEEDVSLSSLIGNLINSILIWTFLLIILITEYGRFRGSKRLRSPLMRSVLYTTIATYLGSAWRVLDSTISIISIMLAGAFIFNATILFAMVYWKGNESTAIIETCMKGL